MGRHWLVVILQVGRVSYLFFDIIIFSNFLQYKCLQDWKSDLQFLCEEKKTNEIEWKTIRLRSCWIHHEIQNMRGERGLTEGASQIDYAFGLYVWEGLHNGNVHISCRWVLDRCWKNDVGRRLKMDNQQ